MDLGPQIKSLRQKMGLTQEELAERADLSKGFISQVEHDLTSPSLDTLEKLVTALGTTLSDFFRPHKNRPLGYPLAQAFCATEEALGHRLHFLIPNAQSLMMEPVLLELSPEGRSKTYAPYEGEVFGFILEGSVLLRLGEREVLLAPEDSFYFAADDAFELIGQGEETARILWVLAPPNF
ncbi:Transcriptional regulator, MerR family, near polyamine transporter [Clostridiaceae bacterium JG1575]|nr:Transcriptional regulator, MerR family, near polyamine transporter [Clostridiaceae bacterium JG1575]